MKTRAHILISGRVQGVFFRLFTRREAGKRNITGWIRNLLDGRVEAVFEGKKEDIDDIIKLCKTGPPHAQVTNVVIDWERFTGLYDGFTIR